MYHITTTTTTFITTTTNSIATSIAISSVFQDPNKTLRKKYLEAYQSRRNLSLSCPVKQVRQNKNIIKAKSNSQINDSPIQSVISQRWMLLQVRQLKFTAHKQWHLIFYIVENVEVEQMKGKKSIQLEEPTWPWSEIPPFTVVKHI